MQSPDVLFHPKNKVFPHLVLLLKNFRRVVLLVRDVYALEVVDVPEN